jgi:ABC-type sugar transport system ATPase subunit
MTSATEQVVGVSSRLAVPALELRGVAKSFGQVRALNRVDFVAYPGEIHVVVGDNGAGKSTTLKIMCGIYRGDSGSVLINDLPVSMQDASEAHAHGIAVVHQDLALVECLDVATNMSLGSIPRLGWFMLDRQRMERNAEEVLNELKIRVGSVRTPIGLLSGGERQIVAIARAVRLNTPIVLLDEPTAALGVRETAHVGQILRELRNQGKAVICISHDLEFVLENADRITVMRLGNSVATRITKNTSRDEIVGLITGAIEGSGMGSGLRHDER